jgi:hypothetical protein
LAKKKLRDFQAIIYPVPTSITQAGSLPVIVYAKNFQMRTETLDLAGNYWQNTRFFTTPKVFCGNFFEMSDDAVIQCDPNAHRRRQLFLEQKRSTDAKPTNGTQI